MSVFYNPCNDVAFKKMFLEHPKRTISFLNAVLRLEGDRRIEAVEFLPQECLPLIAESKKSILDVRVTDHRKFQYIVEVQNSYIKAYLKRVQYYASHVYVGQMKQAQHYHSLKLVTVLSLLNHSLFPNDVPYLSFHQNIETTTQESYMNDITYVFAELPKFHLRYEEIKTLEDHWLFLFKEAQNLDSIPDDAPEEIKDALGTLEEHSWSDVEREAYFKARMIMMDDADALRSAHEKGIEKGIEVGMEKGREEGRSERDLEIARSMLAHGIPSHVISKTTGLSKDII